MERFDFTSIFVEDSQAATISYCQSCLPNPTLSWSNFMALREGVSQGFFPRSLTTEPPFLISIVALFC